MRPLPNHLQAILEADRLGIHVLERPMLTEAPAGSSEEEKAHLVKSGILGNNEDDSKIRVAFPTASFQLFSSVRPHQITELLPTYEMPVNSFTLLPKNVPVEPYIDNGDLVFGTVGYLVDLRQDQPLPARVLAMHESDIVTGYNPYDKRMDGVMWDKTAIPALLEYGAAYPTRAEKLAHAATPDGLRTAEAQMDGMAAFYRALMDGTLPDLPPDHSSRRIYRDGTILLNEVLAAVSMEHVVALVQTTHLPGDRKIVEALQDLQVANHWFELRERGVELPIVRYVPFENAGFELKAETQAEVEQMARDARDTLMDLSAQGKLAFETMPKKDAAEHVGAVLRQLDKFMDMTATPSTDPLHSQVVFGPEEAKPERNWQQHAARRMGSWARGVGDDA